MTRMRHDEMPLAPKEQLLSTQHYLTCRIMRTEFGLSDRKARQWLARFVQQGRLKKEGTPHQPLYFLAE